LKSEYNLTMADAQSILTVGLPTLAVLIGILMNNSRFNDFNSRLGELRADMHRHFDGTSQRFDGISQRFDDTNRRFDDRFDDLSRRIEDTNRRIEDTRDLLRAEFLRVEQVLDARVKHLEER
jgi:hypothetical protein